MFKVFNQYFPHQLLILLVSESVLILAIWGGVAFQFGAWDAMTLSSLIFRAIVATAICQLCLYYADGYDLRSIRTRGEVFFRLIQALGAATLLLAVSLLFLPDAGTNERVVEVAIVASAGILAGVVAFLHDRKPRDIPANITLNRTRLEERRAANEAIAARNAARISATVFHITPAAGVEP